MQEAQGPATYPFCNFNVHHISDSCVVYMVNQQVIDFDAYDQDVREVMRKKGKPSAREQGQAYWQNNPELLARLIMCGRELNENGMKASARGLCELVRWFSRYPPDLAWKILNLIYDVAVNEQDGLKVPNNASSTLTEIFERAGINST